MATVQLDLQCRRATVTFYKSYLRKKLIPILKTTYVAEIICLLSMLLIKCVNNVQRKGLAPIHVAAYKDHGLCLGQLLEAGAATDSKAAGGMVCTHHFLFLFTI